MARTRSAVRLVIAGPPDSPLDLELVERAIERCGVDDRVELLAGWITEERKRDLFATRAAVLTSLRRRLLRLRLARGLPLPQTRDHLPRLGRHRRAGLRRRHRPRHRPGPHVARRRIRPAPRRPRRRPPHGRRRLRAHARAADLIGTTSSPDSPPAMKIAWVTPLGIQSAIAEYSIHVAEALAETCDVRMWASDPPPWRATSLPTTSLGGGNAGELTTFDVRLYNMGDHAVFHRYVASRVPAIPGLLRPARPFVPVALHIDALARVANARAVRRGTTRHDGNEGPRAAAGLDSRACVNRYGTQLRRASAFPLEEERPPAHAGPSFTAIAIGARWSRAGGGRSVASTSRPTGRRRLRRRDRGRWSA